MESSVRSIFRVLIKVPVIIVIAYLIFNLFAFTTSYFKLLGFSYVVMQTAMENNYIPSTEKGVLLSYTNSIESSVLSNVKVGCDTNAKNREPQVDITSTTESENNKVQYGTEIVVTVSGDYNWIFPLVNTSKHDASDTPHADGLQYHETAKDNNSAFKTHMSIQYIVPGLKYYPDLD